MKKLRQMILNQKMLKIQKRRVRLKKRLKQMTRKNWRKQKYKLKKAKIQIKYKNSQVDSLKFIKEMKDEKEIIQRNQNLNL